MQSFDICSGIIFCMRLAGHFQNKPKCKNVQTIGMTLVIYILIYRVVEITFSSCYFIICDYSAYMNETAVYLRAFFFHKYLWQNHFKLFSVVDVSVIKTLASKLVYYMEAFVTTRCLQSKPTRCWLSKMEIKSPIAYSYSKKSRKLSPRLCSYYRYAKHTIRRDYQM